MSAIAAAALASADLPAAAPAPDAIVVTGRALADLPASGAFDIDVIARARIDQVPSGLIEDALGDVAGLQLFRRSSSRAANPSSEGFTLRALGGNAASRTLVLLDGVPQADPFFGSVPIPALDPGDLDAIRVIHGGGSGAFGAGSVAGTIDMTSAGPAARGTADLTVLSDDRGDTSIAGGIAPRLGQGFAVVSGRWDRGPGYWTTPESQRVGASAKSAYDSWSLAARAVAPIAADIELQARIAAFGDTQTLRFAGAVTGMSGEDASVRLVGRGPWQFDALAYGQLRNFTNVTLSSTTFLITNVQRATPSGGFGGKIELRPPLGSAHVLRLGTDYRELTGFEDEDLYTKGAISGRRREGGTNTDWGIYGEEAWTTGPLQLTAGGRADRTTLADGETRTWTAAYVPVSDTAYAPRSDWTGSFRGAALLHALPVLDLRAAAYTGMRQPTLNELYRSFTLFPVTTLANPALVNEILHGIEGGADWRPLPGVALHVTGFDNRILHAINNISINATTQERQNVPAIHANGIEAGAEAKLGTVSFGGSIAWTRARMEAPGQAYDGLRPQQTPLISASANLAWAPRPGWSLAMTLRSDGRAYEDSLQSAALPAATTLGASAIVPITGPFSLILRGENLMNVSVVTRNSGGTIDLGTPRTVWAGVRARLP